MSTVFDRNKTWLANERPGEDRLDAVLALNRLAKV